MIDIATVTQRAARVYAERAAAEARLAAVTSPVYAHDVRLATGGDVRQIDLVTQLHSAEGFNDRTRALVRGELGVAGRSTLDFQIRKMMACLAAAGAWHSVPMLLQVGEEIEEPWMEMRRLGATQRSAAVGWLNDRLDRAYAELGLERDPHITRGEE
jgi:hypothetical protein